MDFTYITVLDFSSGKVYQYNLADVGDNYSFEDNEVQCEEVEELLVYQGHELSDIQWMIHADPTLNKIKL